MIGLHIFTEESSLKTVLEILVPKIIPPEMYFRIYPHQGKQDLERALRTTIPSISKIPGSRIIITRDQDNEDCKILKKNLEGVISNKIFCDYKIRIVCRELESWFLGDLLAVENAFNRFKHDQHINRSDLRDTDNIFKPSETLRQIIPEYSNLDNLPKLETAQKIGIHLNIDKNTSKSFNQMIMAIRTLTKLENNF